MRTSRTFRTGILTSRKRGYVGPYFASLPEYQVELIESYLDFRRFVLNHCNASPERSFITPEREAGGPTVVVARSWRGRPLTFVDPADYDRIQVGDVLCLAGARRALAEWDELMIENATRQPQV